MSETIERTKPESEDEIEESSGIIVSGVPLTKIPDDLFIPPEALLVLLETFEGPLDLLLYLIRKNNLDILDIPISVITEQYMQYVALMKHIKLELAADYLVMAATLAEIKSRMLLPRQVDENDEEIDPRAELVRRLQEYERFKRAATALDELPRRERDIFKAHAAQPEIDETVTHPDVEMQEILMAFKEILERADLYSSHMVEKEPLSIRERMTNVLDRLNDSPFLAFTGLFTVEEGRMGVVVTFIAILELLKQSLIEIVQASEFSPIHVKAATL